MVEGGEGEEVSGWRRRERKVEMGVLRARREMV